MEAIELLRCVATALDSLGVRYFVTGSYATSLYGEMRFTDDIDVVADLNEGHVRGLIGAFPTPDYYVSEEAVRSAIRSRGQFNIIRPDSALKVDVMIPEDSPFNRSRFARRVRLRPGDYEALFASAEDVILKKLEYYREGASEKHLRDIAGVLRISGKRVDVAYVDEWAERLGVMDSWRTVLAKFKDGPKK
jgi:hypothetical protein